MNSLKLGSAVALATFVANGVNNYATTKGTTDGSPTQLTETFNPNDSYAPKSLTGQYEGKTLDVAVTRKMLANGDVQLSYDSTKKSQVDMHLQVQVLGSTSGFEGIKESGTVGGNKLQLSWSPATNVWSGSVWTGSAEQHLTLAGKDMPGNPPALPPSGGTGSGTQVWNETLGTTPSPFKDALAENIHWDNNPQKYYGITAVGADLNGQLLGTPLDLHLTDRQDLI